MGVLLESGELFPFRRRSVCCARGWPTTSDRFRTIGPRFPSVAVAVAIRGALPIPVDPSRVLGDATRRFTFAALDQFFSRASVWWARSFCDRCAPCSGVSPPAFPSAPGCGGGGDGSGTSFWPEQSCARDCWPPRRASTHRCACGLTLRRWRRQGLVTRRSPAACHNYARPLARRHSAAALLQVCAAIDIGMRFEFVRL